MVETLPNAVPTLASIAALNAATAMKTEAAFSFIGLGVTPPGASWGTLVRSGYNYLHESVWYLAAPAIAIVITILLFNTIGEQLQNVLDPRTERR